MSAFPGKLEFLYVGTADFDRDFAYYKDVLEAPLVWAFEKYEARVAAFRLCDGPLYLLADHRPAGSCLLLIAVDDLEAAAAALRARGWRSESDGFEIPPGPCYLFSDPSGNPLAIFQNVRPGLMEERYADPDNPHAIGKP